MKRKTTTVTTLLLSLIAAAGFAEIFFEYTAELSDTTVISTTERNPGGVTIIEPTEEDPGYSGEPVLNPEPPIFGPEPILNPPHCGRFGTRIYYPATTDPLHEPWQQEAINSPATVSGVHLADGAFIHHTVDLSVPSVAMDFTFTRSYRSHLQIDAGGVIGHGWDFGYNKRIVPIGGPPVVGLKSEAWGEGNDVAYLDGTGRRDIFVGADHDLHRVENFGDDFNAYVSTYSSPPGHRVELQRYVITDGTANPFADHPNVLGEESIFYVMRTYSGQREVYNCRGQLIYLIDRTFDMLDRTRNNNRMTFVYGTQMNPLTQSPVMTQILDTAGRAYTLSYTNMGKAGLDTHNGAAHVTGLIDIPRLSSLSDIFGRTVSFNYQSAADPEAVLENVEQSFGESRTTQYGYDPNTRDLTTITAPEQAANNGPPYLTNAYNGRKVVSQTLGGTLDGVTTGGTTGFVYTPNAVNMNRPEGHTHNYQLDRRADATLIKSVSVTSATGPDAGPWTTEFAHDGDFQLISVKQPLGNMTRWERDSANNPVTKGDIRNALGVTYKNDLSKGNVLRIVHTPRAGATLTGYSEISEQFSYEPLFNTVSRHVDKRGNVTEYRYPRVGLYAHAHENGNPTQVVLPNVTQPDGTQLSSIVEDRTYWDYGQIKTRTGPDQLTIFYTYQGAALYPFTITDKTGAVRWLEVDGRGNVERDTYPFGTAEAMTIRSIYDLADRVEERIEDDNGANHQTTFDYDLNDNRTRASVTVKDDFTPGAGRPATVATKVVETEWRYTLLDEVREITEDVGGRNRVTTISPRAGQTSQRKTTPHPQGSGTVYVETEFDARGLPFEVRQQLEGADEAITNLKYDNNGNRTEIEDAAGKTTITTYDAFDRATASTKPDGTSTTLELDRAGHPISKEVFGPKGGGSFGMLARENVTFDEWGRAVSTTRLIDPDQPTGPSATTQRFFLANGRLDRVVAPNGGSAQYAYDAKGRVSTVTDPTGNVVRSEYDGANRLHRKVLRDREVVVDVVTQAPTVSFVERGTTYHYDNLGRLVGEDGPSGKGTKLFLDSRGLVRGLVDSAGQLAERTFDGLGLVERVDTPKSTMVLTHSVAGFKKRVVVLGPDGTFFDHSVDFTYDGAGRLKTRTESGPRGPSTWTFNHDALGNVVFSRDANGTETTVGYDPQYRRSSLDVVYSPARGGFFPSLSGSTEERFEYDGLGRMVRADNNFARTTLSYDGLGRTLQEVQSTSDGITASYVDPVTVTHVWDPSFTRRTMSVDGLAAAAYDYDIDALGRTTEVNAGTDLLVNYVYAGASRVAFRKTGGAFLKESTSYDSAGRPVRTDIEPLGAWIGAANWTGVRTWSYPTIPGTADVETETFFDGPKVNHRRRETTRDSQLRITKQRTLNTRTDAGNLERFLASTSFSNFDAHGRLVERGSYTFDGVAEQVSQARIDTVSLAARSEVSAVDTKITGGISTLAEPADLAATRALVTTPQYQDQQTFVRDQIGHVIEDDRYFYSYDHAGRLTGARDKFVRSGGLFSGTTFEVEYRYDALGRLSARLPSPTNNQSLYRFPKLRFVHDGKNVIGEIDITGAPTLLARYAYGRSGDLVRMERRRDESLQGAMEPHWISLRPSGQIGFVTDDSGVRLALRRADDGVLEDVQMLGSRTTRMPYASVGQRYLPFVDRIVDERGGRAPYNPFAAWTLQWSMETDAFNQRVFAENQRIARPGVIGMSLALWPMAVSGMTLNGFLYGGATGAGINAAIHNIAGVHYGAAQLAEDFVLGGISGGVAGKLSASLNVGKLAMVAATTASDIAVGTAWDVMVHGDAPVTALTSNVVANAVGALTGGLSARFAGDVRIRRTSPPRGMPQPNLQALDHTTLPREVQLLVRHLTRTMDAFVPRWRGTADCVSRSLTVMLNNRIDPKAWIHLEGGRARNYSALNKLLRTKRGGVDRRRTRRILKTRGRNYATSGYSRGPNGVYRESTIGLMGLDAAIAGRGSLTIFLLQGANQVRPRVWAGHTAIGIYSNANPSRLFVWDGQARGCVFDAAEWIQDYQHIGLTFLGGPAR